MAGIGGASNPGPLLLFGAALSVGVGLWKLSVCSEGYSLIYFGFAAILLEGGLWMFIEGVDAFEHALTPGVLLGLILAGVGWNQRSAVGCSLL